MKVNQYPVYDTGVVQTHVHPGLSAIQCSKNSFTTILRVAGVSFSGTNPYFTWVLLIYFYRTDSKGRLIIKYGFPFQSTIL